MIEFTVFRANICSLITSFKLYNIILGELVDYCDIRNNYIHIIRGTSSYQWCIGCCFHGATDIFNASSSSDLISEGWHPTRWLLGATMVTCTWLSEYIGVSRSSHWL